MELELVLKSIPIALSVLAIVVAGARWVSTKAFVPREDFAAMGAKVDLRGHEIAILRKEIEHLPNAEQFSELSRGLVKLATLTDGLGARLGHVDAAVTRIEDYLLKGRP